MARLTTYQRAILTFLNSRLFMQTTPTMIGMEIGWREHSGASAWACKRLKPLVVRRLVTRRHGGLYEINASGVAALQEPA